MNELNSMSSEQRLQADEQSRLAALDPARSCIVQAPAGSGKTELLIQRFLALLATVDMPEEIVAITFTRKAAAEMRVRIMLALDNAASVQPDEEHAMRTWELARAVLERDASNRWNIREQPSRLRIMTIDSFNGWITRQMPWVSGVGAQPTIADDATDLYREAVRAVLLAPQADATIREHIARLLTHLDNRYYIIEALLVGMLAIRDQWIPAIFSSSVNTDTARTVMEKTLGELITQHLHTLRASLPSDVSDQLADLTRHAAQNLLRPETGYEAGALEACADITTVPGESPGDLEQWLGIAHLLLTSTDELRKPRGVTVRLGFERTDPEKERLQALLEHLLDYPDWVEQLAGLRLLPSPRFSDGQWMMLESILQVLLLCLSSLRELFGIRGVLDHPEMAFAAAEALGSDLQPTDLALIMEYRIQHLLVDEFQDTSSTQFRLIELLTSGWTAEDGHTLFLVGDPMQSIYRFREAEVGLFLRVWEQSRIGSVPLQTLRLYRNFRSQERIVTWVNKTFSSIMPAQNDVARGAVAFVEAAATQPGYEDGVSIETVFTGSRMDEAERIMSLLQQIRQDTQMHGQTTAILVRSRSHLADLVPRLRQAGVPFQAVEIEALGRHPAVQDILALARALSHPGDRTAWLAVLRAPWCGLQTEDLHALAAADASALLPRLIDSDTELARLSDEGRKRVSHVRECMSKVHAQAGRKSLRRLVEGCWIDLGGPATVDALGFDAAMSCLDMLDMVAAQGDLMDLESLYREVEKLYAPPDPAADGKLQIMTIHKAKGLQFDTVIVPRLDGKPRNADRRLMLWMEQTGRDSLDFLLAPLAARGEEEDATYRYVRKSLAVKDEYEYLRLLYVAVTRARRRLYLTAVVHPDPKSDLLALAAPSARSFLAYLWPVIQSEIQERYLARTSLSVTPHLPPQDVVDTEASLRRLSLRWTPPPLPAALNVEESAVDDGSNPQRTAPTVWKAGLHARERGIAVHRLLAQIGRNGIDWWEGQSSTAQKALVRALCHDSAGDVDNEDEREKAFMAIEKMCADERGKWILAEHKDARCEYALTGLWRDSVTTVIIDRTFIDEDNIRWIVDYKTSAHEGSDLSGFIALQEAAYREQLLRYTEFMRRKEDREVRAALYFPLLQAWKVVV